MYNIPVSISDATAQNPTAQIGGGTVINFGANASVRGDMQTLENTTDQRPTATSSASTGGPAASETAIQNERGEQPSLIGPVVAIGAIGIVGLIVWKLF